MRATNLLVTPAGATRAPYPIDLALISACRNGRYQRKDQRAYALVGHGVSIILKLFFVLNHSIVDRSTRQIK